MKMKIERKEYKRLLERVDCLEEKLERDHESMFENWIWTREYLYKMMEDYFKTKCMTVVMERDKNMIVAEVRKQAMNNLFKENKK